MNELEVKLKAIKERVESTSYLGIGVKLGLLSDKNCKNFYPI